MRRKKVVTGERIVDRLRYVLFDMNKNETEMSRECGIPMGAVSAAKRPGNDLSELQYRRILEKYPFVNEAWLLRGEGERYKDGRKASVPMPMPIGAPAGDGDGGNVGAPADGGNQRLVEYLMEQNARLQEQVSDLVSLLRTTLGKGGATHGAQGESDAPTAN